VIISDACGIRSLVEGRAGLVVPPAVGPLTDALRTLLTDRVLYAKFQEGCRIATEEMSWSSLAAKMSGYYEEVLAATDRAAMTA